MTFSAFVTSIVGAINTVVVPLIFAFCFAAFMWGMANYFFLSGGSEEKRASGRAFALSGVLGMVVLVSLWGLVNILLSTLIPASAY